MTASSYRLVVFDWDGTLMDSATRIVHSVRSAIAASGLPARSPEQIRSIIGLGLREAVAWLYPDASEADRQRLAEGYRTAFATARAATPAGLFPGAEAVLDRLDRNGHLLAIATGKSERGLRRELRETGLLERFVAVRTVDHCPSKPHPAMVEELMADCSTAAAETLVVGDTLFDLEMAANAGVDAIGVSWGAHPPGRLERAGPRGIVRDFDELGRWIMDAGWAG